MLIVAVVAYNSYSRDRPCAYDRTCAFHGTSISKLFVHRAHRKVQVLEYFSSAQDYDTCSACPIWLSMILEESCEAVYF